MKILSFILLLFSLNFSQAGTNTGCSHNSWETSSKGKFVGVHFIVVEDLKYKWFFNISGKQTRGCGEVSGANRIRKAYRHKGAEIQNRYRHYSFDPYKGNLKITQSGHLQCECAGTYENLTFSACNTYQPWDNFEKVEDYYKNQPQEVSDIPPEDYLRAEEVIAVLNTDFNGDGKLDKAVLSQSLLFVYLGVFQKSKMKRVLTKKVTDLVSRLGLTLSLGTNNRGSIIINTETNESASRTTEKITLAYRNNAFVVAGYNYDYDVVRGKMFDFKCEINFLSRRSVVNGKSFKLPTKAMNVSNWSRKAIPKQCHSH